MLLPLIVASGLALATILDTGVYTPPDDSGDSGDDSGDDDSGDDGSVVVQPPENHYDGHLDGKTASQMAGDEGGCATVGESAQLALVLVLVGVAAGRLRRPRR